MRYFFSRSAMTKQTPAVMEIWARYNNKTLFEFKLSLSNLAFLSTGSG